MDTHYRPSRVHVVEDSRMTTASCVYVCVRMAFTVRVVCELEWRGPANTRPLAFKTRSLTVPSDGTSTRVVPLSLRTRTIYTETGKMGQYPSCACFAWSCGFWAPFYSRMSMSLIRLLGISCHGCHDNLVVEHGASWRVRVGEQHWVRRYVRLSGW